MKSIITPSMMCADLMNMKETLSTFKQHNIEYLHIDVMDGEFVPNYAIGTDYCNQLRKSCDIPLDIHLMVNRPEEKIKYFKICKGDIVSVHAESTVHMQRVLSYINGIGAKPYAALNPATPLCFVDHILDDVSGILLMTVNPGYAGQKLIPATLDKIKTLREMLDSKGYENIRIEVDGNVSFENALLMKKAGADVFVAGSSSVFSEKASLSDNITMLEKAVGLTD